MSDIPAARERIAFLRDNISAPHVRAEFNNILALMTREKPSRRKAPIKYRCLSDQQAETVRAYAFRHPDLSLLEIANEFKTNPGRVSEALARKRDRA